VPTVHWSKGQADGLRGPVRAARARIPVFRRLK
jgi:hypothetical protein